MNSNVMCSYCKTGRIRPIHCSLEEAVIKCDNLECESYLEKWPWEIIISKPVIEESIPYKNGVIFGGAESDAVPHSPVASHGSLVDQEVEELLSGSHDCINVLLNSKPPRLKTSYTFEDDHSHDKYSWGNSPPSNFDCTSFNVEDVKNDGSYFDVLSDIQFEDLISQSPKRCPLNTFVAETKQKSSLQSIHDLLLEPNYSHDKNSSQITISSPIVSPLKSSKYNTTHLNIQSPVVSPLKNTIPSNLSAFSQVSPYKIFIEDTSCLSLNEGMRDALSEDGTSLHCKKGKDFIFENISNFLSPASSGSSEDSGFTEEDAALRHENLSVERNVSLLSDRTTQNVVNNTSHINLDNEDSVQISLPKNQDCSSSSNFSRTPTLSDTFHTLELNLHEDAHTPTSEAKYSSFPISKSHVQSDLDQDHAPLCILSQESESAASEKLLDSEGAEIDISEATLIGEDSLQDSLSNQSSNHSNVEKVQNHEQFAYSVDISRELVASNNYGNNTRQRKSQGQFVKDPWSIPEFQLEQLDIEVVLKSKEPSLSNGNNTNESISSPVDRSVGISEESTGCDGMGQTFSKSAMNPLQKQLSPAIERKHENSSGIETVSVGIYKPVILTPQVAGTPFANSSSSSFVNVPDGESIRESVGYLSTNESPSTTPTKGKKRTPFGQLAQYFDILTSSVDFDETFFHGIHAEDFDDLSTLENSCSTNLFDGSTVATDPDRIGYSSAKYKARSRKKPHAKSNPGKLLQKRGKVYKKSIPTICVGLDDEVIIENKNSINHNKKFNHDEPYNAASSLRRNRPCSASFSAKCHDQSKVQMIPPEESTSLRDVSHSDDYFETTRDPGMCESDSMITLPVSSVDDVTLSEISLMMSEDLEFGQLNTEPQGLHKYCSDEVDPTQNSISSLFIRSLSPDFLFSEDEGFSQCMNGSNCEDLMETEVLADFEANSLPLDSNTSMRECFASNNTPQPSMSYQSVLSKLSNSPSDSEALEVLLQSGWVVASGTPEINYNPTGLKSPTVIPLPLQHQYSNLSSDVIWTHHEKRNLLQQQKIYTRPSRIPVNDCEETSTINSSNVKIQATKINSNLGKSRKISDIFSYFKLFNTEYKLEHTSDIRKKDKKFGKHAKIDGGNQQKENSKQPEGRTSSNIDLKEKANCLNKCTFDCEDSKNISEYAAAEVDSKLSTVSVGSGGTYPRPSAMMKKKLAEIRACTEVLSSKETFDDLELSDDDLELPDDFVAYDQVSCGGYKCRPPEIPITRSIDTPQPKTASEITPEVPSRKKVKSKRKRKNRFEEATLSVLEETLNTEETMLQKAETALGNAVFHTGEKCIPTMIGMCLGGKVYVYSRDKS